MRHVWLLIALLIALLVAAPLRVATAQEGTPPAEQQLEQDSASPQQRALLMQQLQQRLAEVVQRQLQLTPDQAQRLRAVNQKYEAPRREMVQEEQEARRTLRQELQQGEGADQSRVNEMMDRLVQIQQRRLDLFRSEQRDLAGFLSPVQRARYAALQEQFRRRLEQFRQRRLERQELRRGLRGGRPPRVGRP